MKGITASTRTAIKATIKRASALAREKANRFDRKTLDQLSELYKKSISDLQAIILSYADTSGNLKLDTLNNLLTQAQQRLGLLNAARDEMLKNALNQSSTLGVAPFTGVVTASTLSRLANEAAAFTTNFIGEDGLQLSDRIWRINNHATQIVADAINSAVIEGHSASQATDAFLSSGQPVPGTVIRKIEASNASAVAHKVGRDLIKTGSPRDNALRLFRTEINRAHGEAYMSSGASVPGFIGWKFILSPRHPQPDICDMHANANIYGLGPGVYPTRGKTPWPAHPNTLSYTEIVFKSEVTQQDRSSKSSRIEWLKKQPAGRQVSVLNSRKKRAALLKGLLKKNQIATPWNVLKKHYERKGINIKKLTDS